MKFGLAVNVNETVKEVVEKSIHAEQFGLDYIWVSDVPSQRYAFTVASAIATHTKTIRVGVGLLSCFLFSPEQIADGFSTLTEAHGNRFELLIGPGDRDQLSRVGVSWAHPKSVVNYTLECKEKIKQRLGEDKVWLGAQGPKLLETARFFNGVFMNYASPKLVEWAVNRVGSVGREGFQFGVYTPAYVYDKFDRKIFNLARGASTVVALGDSDFVLKKLGIYEKINAAREKIKKGLTFKSILDEIPSEIVEMFAVHKPSSELQSYLAELSRLGIKHIVFSYPQGFSAKTIKDLANALP